MLVAASCPFCSVQDQACPLCSSIGDFFSGKGKGHQLSPNKMSTSQAVVRPDDIESLIKVRQDHSDKTSSYLQAYAQPSASFEAANFKQACMQASAVSSHFNPRNHTNGMLILTYWRGTLSLTRPPGKRRLRWRVSSDDNLRGVPHEWITHDCLKVYACVPLHFSPHLFESCLRIISEHSACDGCLSAFCAMLLADRATISLE